MRYSIDEQETHLDFDPIEKMWTIETNYSPHIKKILKEPEAYEIIYQDMDDEQVTSITAKMKLDKFSLNPFPRKKREYTEEEKEEMRKRLQRVRNK